MGYVLKSIVIFFVFAEVFVAGCVKSAPKKGAAEPSQNKKIVNLAIWSNFISPELVIQFEKKTGIQIQISNYSSNEELLAKLQAGASGYDVVVPSDYMIFVMEKLGLLVPLDFSKLPNSKNIDSRFLKKPFDPENRYSIPYDWGTTGIAVNRKLYSGKIEGWKDLFTREDLAGRITLLDDAREVIGAALKMQGFSLNSKVPNQLLQAKEILMKARKRVKAFTSEPLMPLRNGEVAVTQIFMSDALQVQRAIGKHIEYLVPQEGGTLWVDSLVIPNGALHLQEAHELINFLLEPSSNVSTVKNVLAAPANKEAFELLPKELKANQSLFPPASVLEKCEMIQDIGELLSVWDRIWVELKAQND